MPNEIDLSPYVKIFNAYGFQIQGGNLKQAQIFLSNPDIVGRFVWYARTGSLVYEQTSGAVSAGNAKDPEALIKLMLERGQEKNT